MQNVGAAIGTFFFVNLILFSISPAQDKKCDPRPCGTALYTWVKKCDRLPEKYYTQCVGDGRSEYVICLRDTCPNESPAFPLQH